MGFLDGWEPKPGTDDSEFKPLKGAYVCRIDGLTRKVGVSERTGDDYDFYTLKLQVTDTIEGDRGTNRYLDKVYNSDDNGRRALANDLFTAGIEFDKTSEDAFDASLVTTKDKTMNVRAWSRPKMVKIGDEWEKKEPEELKQYIKKVKEFKLKGVPKSTENVKTETTPF